jgi:hypothetical protein
VNPKTVPVTTMVKRAVRSGYVELLLKAALDHIDATPLALLRNVRRLFHDDTARTDHHVLERDRVKYDVGVGVERRGPLPIAEHDGLIEPADEWGPGRRRATSRQRRSVRRVHCRRSCGRVSGVSHDGLLVGRRIERLEATLQR